MKICLLSYRGNPYCGGQGVYLMYIARELVKLGHEVHAVVGPPYPFPMEGVALHPISNHNYFNVKKNFIKPHRPFATLEPLNLYEFIASKFGIFPEIESYSFRVFMKLKKLLRKHRFDIIHDNQCLGYGFLLVKLFGIPLVSTIHHPLTIDRATWFEYPSDFMLKVKRVLYYPLIMQKFVANRLDRVITVSHNAAEEIGGAFGVPREKISVVYNGLDADLFHQPAGIPRKKNSLIFVGNVEDRKKGIIYLLKAMTLSRHTPVLTIVDGGAPNRRFIPYWINRYGLNSRVVFTGKITNDEMVRRYAETEIAVAPSLYEGFGFPVAEAMACGLPVITTTGGAVPEVAGAHLETAYLVPPRDPEALAGAIDYLLDNPEARARMGTAGRERVRALFTWENAAKELVKIYGDVIHAHG